jgi:hypothetical protein
MMTQDKQHQQYSSPVLLQATEDAIVQIVFWIGLIGLIIICSLLNCYIEQHRDAKYFRPNKQINNNKKTDNDNNN